jgi:hypothetical protein
MGLPKGNGMIARRVKYTAIVAEAGDPWSRLYQVAID